MSKLFIIGIIIAILYSNIILPRKVDENPKININFYPILYKGMIIINYYKNNCIHIHHWILYLFIFLILLNKNNNKYLLLKGFVFTMFLQGLLYKDFYILSCKNPYKN